MPHPTLHACEVKMPTQGELDPVALSLHLHLPFITFPSVINVNFLHFSETIILTKYKKSDNLAISFLDK